MLVGEAPGEAEARTGKPFMGKAGMVLNALILEADLEGEVYITNVVKCRPPQNRKPEGVEINICSDAYLDREIALLRPRVIVALGVPATSRFFRSKTWRRGIVQFNSHYKTKVIPTWHPSYVARFVSRTARDELLGALKLAKEQAQ